MSGHGACKSRNAFLPDMYIKCDQCDGKRFNRETLQIKYNGKNVNDILEMSVEEAVKFYKTIKQFLEN